MVKVGRKAQTLGTSCLCKNSIFSKCFKRHLYNYENYLWAKYQLNLTFFTRGFLAVNWAPKWTKTVNFGCVPFESKFKILKDFWNTAFVLLSYTSDHFSEIEQYLREYSPKKLKKGAISWMLYQEINFTLHNHISCTVETCHRTVSW